MVYSAFNKFSKLWTEQSETKIFIKNLLKFNAQKNVESKGFPKMDLCSFQKLIVAVLSAVEIREDS